MRSHWQIGALPWGKPSNITDQKYALPILIMKERKWKWKSFSRVQLCNPMDYTVHGILQARILEWVDFPFSRGSSQPRDRNCLLHYRQILYQLSHRESPFSLYYQFLFLVSGASGNMIAPCNVYGILDSKQKGDFTRHHMECQENAKQTYKWSKGHQLEKNA